MAQRIFGLKNIHCKSCKHLIESAASELLGVNSINVDLKSRECKFNFDEGKISEKEIAELIESLGYEAE
jgi:copper chaperone CopZ